MRRALTVLTAAVTAALVATPAAAAPYDGNGEVLNVLPPGSSGNVAVQDLLDLGLTTLPGLDPTDPQGSLLTATGTVPRHYADQLEMYDALNHADLGMQPFSVMMGALQVGEKLSFSYRVVARPTP